MKSATRYGLIGIGALAVLSLVHWMRDSKYHGPELVMYLIGVLPNVAAAIAIPFVVLSIWTDQKPSASHHEVRRAFIVLTVGAGVALIAWEFLQQSSRTLIFDFDDILATLAGLGLAWLLFAALTPSAPGRERQS